MGLTKTQKKYLNENARQFSPEQLAADTGLPRSQILDYLKNRWRPEKYQKYLQRFSQGMEKKLKAFSFRQFWRDNWMILALLTFLVIVSYANSINNGFVSDDVGGIYTNPNLGSFSNYVALSPIGFVQRLVWFMAFKLGGLNPAFFRIPNIFYHLGATLTFFLVIYLMAPRTLAVMAAALFAVHPILVESVTWISGSPYSQPGLFFLLSLAAYILAKQKSRYYFVSLAFFLLTISASERGAVLCVIFVAYELAFGNIRISWKKLLPFFAVSFLEIINLLGQIGARVTSLKETYYLQPGKDSLFIKIPTSVATYFHLIFWPDQLSLYQTEMIFTPWQYRFTVLVFLVYLVLIVYFFKKNKLLSFWLFFFMVPLAPTLTPLRIAWAVAERYAYLSAAGILVFIAWIFYKFSEKEKFKMVAYMLFWLIVVALSVRTIIRNGDWKNEESLWFATAKTSPSGPNIHNNLGYIYFQKGEYDKAISEFHLAIAINPAYGDAYHNLGNAYYQMNKLQEATESYQKALELNSRLWQSHQNLAAIYFGQSWYDLARQEIQKAVEIMPDNADLQKNLDLINSSAQSSQPSQPVTTPAL